MRHLALTCLALTACAGAPEQLVTVGPDGRLIHHADERGDRLPDYSYCGYRWGAEPLPDVPTVATLAVGEGDQTARVQAALDELAARPVGPDGFRGALLLRRGLWRIGGAIKITASGIVLRGEGDGEDGTILLATGTGQRTLVQFSGSAPKEFPETRQPITDERVPLGSRRVTVADAAPFSVGDVVQVRRLSTAEWIHELGMDRIKPNPGVVQWTAGSKDLPFVRVIEAIEGRTLVLDAPLGSPIERAWGGGRVSKLGARDLLRQVGLEAIRGDSEFTSPTDEDHGWNFVGFEAVEDGWARNLTAVHFGYACVTCGRQARRLTIRDCRNLEPVSQITGGRRYAYNLMGQLLLFYRCYARDGRHDFVTGSTVCGPNAFVECVAERARADSGPHHRWAVSTLFDNVRCGPLNVQDRGPSGSGHGWAGAWQVFWNCTATSMDIQRPPTANNWAIGCVAPKQTGSGTWISPGQPVEPRSLYRAQLTDRIGAARAEEVLR